jgi:Na+/H+-dicarboxylate symporter
VCLSCNKYHYLHLQKFQNLFVCLYCSFALINLYVLPMLLWRCLFFSRSTWSCFTTFVVHCFKSSNSR